MTCTIYIPVYRLKVDEDDDDEDDVESGEGGLVDVDSADSDSDGSDDFAKVDPSKKDTVFCKEEQLAMDPCQQVGWLLLHSISCGLIKFMWQFHLIIF